MDACEIKRETKERNIKVNLRQTSEAERKYVGKNVDNWNMCKNEQIIQTNEDKRGKNGEEIEITLKWLNTKGKKQKICERESLKLKFVREIR